jgi:hypothetical protein
MKSVSRPIAQSYDDRLSKLNKNHPSAQRRSEIPACDQYLHQHYQAFKVEEKRFRRGKRPGLSNNKYCEYISRPLFHIKSTSELLVQEHYLTR